MMPLTIAWEYLTGYAVATDPSNRERAEWPPHPARVFMAMAAAWFETAPTDGCVGEDHRNHQAEGDALRWLESLGEPELWLPPFHADHERSQVTVYVPVNDATPQNIDGNKTYQEIVATEVEKVTPDSVKCWIEAIDKSAKTATVVPTSSRIQVLSKLRRVAAPDNKDGFRCLRATVEDAVRGTSIKKFIREALEVMPEHRSRQARTFPRQYIGETPCLLRWPEADNQPKHFDALDRLCRKVTRIGHSSSLVRLWVADSLDDETSSALERWQPDGALATVYCRRISPGLLDALPEQTQIPRIETFARMVWEIQDAEQGEETANAAEDLQAKKEAKQRLKHAKQTYEKEFGETYKKNSASAPPRLRPKIGLWTGYRRVESVDVEPGIASSHFDTDLLVLTQTGGPVLPLVSTLRVSEAVRGTVMYHSGVQPVPQWISGHQSDGTPNEKETGHLAFLPLPFVGHKRADGHLLGVALAFPRNIDRQDRGRVLGPLLVDENGEPKEFELKLGKLGVCRLGMRDWSEPRQTLRPEGWTAHPYGETAWASVTPVVLDAFPKADRRDPRQRQRWEQEVRSIIATACIRIGLPYPIHIDIDTTSWHIGSPRAVTKRRLLRGHSGTSGTERAHLGDGFPAYPAKGTNAPRPQVHVFVQFAEPVLGPVLLGAGRYRGYGFLKPWGTAQ